MRTQDWFNNRCFHGVQEPTKLPLNPDVAMGRAHALADLGGFARPNQTPANFGLYNDAVTHENFEFITHE